MALANQIGALFARVFGPKGEALEAMTREATEAALKTLFGYMKQSSLLSSAGIFAVTSAMLASISHGKRVALFAIIAGAIRSDTRIPLAVREGFALVLDATPDAFQGLLLDEKLGENAQAKYEEAFKQKVEPKIREVEKTLKSGKLPGALLASLNAPQRLSIANLHTASKSLVGIWNNDRARHAAEAQGMAPFPVTIDAHGPDYLSRAIVSMFENENVDTINELFEGMPDVGEYMTALNPDGTPWNDAKRVAFMVSLRPYIARLKLMYDIVDGEHPIKEFFAKDWKEQIVLMSDALMSPSRRAQAAFAARFVGDGASALADAILHRVAPIVFAFVGILLALGAISLLVIDPSSALCVAVANGAAVAAVVYTVAGFGIGPAIFLYSRAQTQFSWPPEDDDARVHREQTVGLERQRLDRVEGMRRAEHMLTQARRTATSIAVAATTLWGIPLTLIGVWMLVVFTQFASHGWYAFQSLIMLAVSIGLFWVTLTWQEIAPTAAANAVAHVVRSTGLVEQIGGWEPPTWTRSIAAKISAAGFGFALAMFAFGLLVGPMPTSPILAGVAAGFIAYLMGNFGVSAIEYSGSYGDSKPELEEQRIGLRKLFFRASHFSMKYSLLIALAFAVYTRIVGVPLVDTYFLRGTGHVVAAAGADVVDYGAAVVGTNPVTGEGCTKKSIEDIRLQVKLHGNCEGSRGRKFCANIKPTLDTECQKYVRSN